jgi:hypothetical protein
MNKTNIEVCPFCGASPKMKIEKIPKLIGSPQPQKYIYYYTCTCGKVVASSANDCVMTAQEAIDYAGYLWNSACQRVKPVAPTPVEDEPVKVEVTEPVKKTPRAKKVESLGSFVETVIAAVEEKAVEEEPVKAEPEEVQEPVTEAPTEDVPTEEVGQEVVDTQPKQEEPVEPVEEPATVVEETPKPTKSASSNPMLASLDDILGTTPRKKSTKNN